MLVDGTQESYAMQKWKIRGEMLLVDGELELLACARLREDRLTNSSQTSGLKSGEERGSRSCFEM